MESGVALNEDGAEEAGMGLGIGDFNLDGRLDILKTHFTEDTPALYSNSARGQFDDVTIASGLGVETRYVSWGAAIRTWTMMAGPICFGSPAAFIRKWKRSCLSFPTAALASCFVILETADLKNC